MSSPFQIAAMERDSCRRVGLAWLACGAGLISLLGGCETVDKMAVTASGKPEAVINAEVGVIKSAIIGDMVNYKYVVDQDTEYMLRMSRALEGAENFAAALSTWNSYSTNRRVTIYTFVKQADGVRVIVSSAWQAQMPGGQVNTSSEITDGGKGFNTFQTQLNDIKRRLEKPN